MALHILFIGDWTTRSDSAGSKTKCDYRMKEKRLLASSSTLGSHSRSMTSGLGLSSIDPILGEVGWNARVDQLPSSIAQKAADNICSAEPKAVSIAGNKWRLPVISYVSYLASVGL